MKCPSVFGECTLVPELIPTAQLPTMLSGRSVTWDAGYTPLVVYIAKFEIAGVPIYLFGHRCDLSRSSEQITGFALQFIITAEPRAGTPVYLAQSRGVVYASVSDSIGWQNARDCKKQLNQTVHLPRWKWNHAQWPTLRETMMSFVDQVDLPQNDVTESYLSFNRSVFLFGLESSSGWTAAITCQQTVFQTAEEHYLAESRRSKKSTKPRKPHSRDGRNNEP